MCCCFSRFCALCVCVCVCVQVRTAAPPGLFEQCKQEVNALERSHAHFSADGKEIVFEMHSNVCAVPVAHCCCSFSRCVLVQITRSLSSLTAMLTDVEVIPKLREAVLANRLFHLLFVSHF